MRHSNSISINQNFTICYLLKSFFYILFDKKILVVISLKPLAKVMHFYQKNVTSIRQLVFIIYIQLLLKYPSAPNKVSYVGNLFYQNIRLLETNLILHLCCTFSKLKGSVEVLLGHCSENSEIVNNI